MSYILDALKKSEEENKLGNLQTLETPAMGYVQLNKPNHSKLYIVITFLILLVASLVGFVIYDFFADKNQQSDISKDIPIQELSSPVEDMARQQAEIAGLQKNDNVQPLTEELTPVVKESQSNAQLSTQASNQPQQVDSDAALISDNLPDEISSMTLNVISYSPNATASFVMINSKLYRNADVLENGAIIKEIKADGVVISYEGTSYFRAP